MICRRAYELDLAAFLEDPRDAAWDDFRAHYPRCADCAPEVAAWTTLHAALDRHPDPDALLRWSDDRAGLAAAEQTRVARHLERCASCRDELRALARFAAPAAVAADGTAVPADAPPAHHPTATRSGGRHGESRPGRRPGSIRDATRSGGRRTASLLRRIVWQPAFAYAVLIVVILLPTFRERFERGAEHVVDGERVQPATELRRAPGVRAGDAPQPDEGDVAPGPDPDDALVDRTAPRLLRQKPAHVAPAPRAEAPAAAAAPPSSLAPRPAARDAGSDDALHAASGRVMRSLGTTEGEPGAVRLLPAGGGDRGRVLAITLPPHLAGARVLEVRIRDDAGGRELRQKVERAAGAPAQVTLELPVGFSAPRLVVEVYSDGVGPLAGGVVSP